MYLYSLDAGENARYPERWRSFFQFCREIPV